MAADGLDYQPGEGHRADAGVALGAWLEAAAEPAGLITGETDLEATMVNRLLERTTPKPHRGTLV
jgi:hypothetical protein